MEMIQIKGLLSIQRLTARRASPQPGETLSARQESPPEAGRRPALPLVTPFLGATLARPWSAGFLPPPPRVTATGSPAA